jgi:hypothetical protein
VRNSEEKNPGYLDTLAWAHYRMGDAATSAEVQRKALRAIDGNVMFMRMPARRKEIERRAENIRCGRRGKEITRNGTFRAAIPLMG